MRHLRVFTAPLLLFAALRLDAQDRATIVTTDWLSQRLTDPKVVVLQVIRDTAAFAAAHIPGAREIQYTWITMVRDSVGTEFPPADSLRRVFERAGVSDDSHVVLYTSSIGLAPVASRAFLSLDYVGVKRISMLNGGLARWRAEGRAIATGRADVAPGRITSSPRDIVVNADWVMAHRGRKGVAFIDTRTDSEYVGLTSARLPSEGHVAGAKQLQWQQLFASSDSSVFLDLESLAKLYADRSAPGDTIVTYCLVGYRASMTYFAARALGLPVKIYDGSYQDWARRGLPVVKGATP
jgi:thiosulfate/3-mercaptopyruvate sulfurtransferase